MRLLALYIKEFKLILRDPSSIIITVFLPISLLIIYGYGVNLDTTKIKLGLLNSSSSSSSVNFVNSMLGSGFLEVHSSQSEKELQELLDKREIKGILYIDDDFENALNRNEAKFGLVTDGSEPNIANFLQNYIKASFGIFLEQKMLSEGKKANFNINIEPLFWFNKAAISTNFILPGSICITMTVIGAILTSLVIAKEYENGTLESLISTPMTKLEFLLSKFFPYFILALIALSLSLIVAVWVIGVPFQGSLWLIYLTSSFFIFAVLVIGLFISAATKDQFNAAMIALNISYLPAIMLSGFVFDISSMPKILQLITYAFPARYYVESLQTLFLAGNVFSILFINSIFMLLFFSIVVSLLFRKFQLKMD